MIKSIHLRNWKTHYDSLFEFSKGTNVLVGQMGAGKTSVVDAISYALFGTFPALQAKLSTLDEAVMRKPNEMKEAELEVCFSADGKEFTVKRIARKGRKANEAYLHEGSRLIAGPKQSDVNERIEALLGLDYNLFSRAVYCGQNETDYFLKHSPGDRKKTLDELFELERYEKARGNAVQAKNRLKKLAEDKAGLLKGFDSGREAKALEEEEKAIKEKESELACIEEKAGEMKKQLAEAKNELDELKERKKAFDSIRKELVELKAELKVASDGMQGKKPSKKAHELRVLIDESKKTVEKAGAEAEGLIRIVEAGETEKKLAEKELAGLKERQELLKAGQKKLEGLKAACLKELEEKLGASRTDSGSLEAKLELALNALKALEGAEASCPTCEQELGA
ncbi:SMC family ATPase, partial [archaeon]|nr:SMC family ATPase [archaeon]